MAETVDVQSMTIGVGTGTAILALVYGALVDGSVVGLDASTVAVGAFAVTFLAVGVLHGAYGRGSFAVACATAGIGLGLVALAASGGQVLVGYVLLFAGGGYVAVATARARAD
ncbi:hypothetical protein [Halopiger djelfimassiliensis]|uniref:hypothetical protein n=1 Tax=Halopiger djelfimassiliensis TaxID=1293047 RepID=UPI0006776F79|nr:hypothetical protein [Halopiger djelfimassiliensis]